MGRLSGIHIVNTRAAHQAPEFDALMRAAGASPVAYPCIAIAAPLETGPLDTALRQLEAGRFHWLVLTSFNAVIGISDRIDQLGLHLGKIQRTPIAAVGDATATETARRLGVCAAFVPGRTAGDDLGEHLPLQTGQHVLFPASSIALQAVPKALRQRGAIVDVVTAYRTMSGEGGDPVPSMLRRREIDVVTFTSPSTVEGFVRRLLDEGGDLLDLQHVQLVCIGETTRQAALNLNLPNPVAPEEQSLQGMVELIADLARHSAGAAR